MSNATIKEEMPSDVMSNLANSINVLVFARKFQFDANGRNERQREGCLTYKYSSLLSSLHPSIIMSSEFTDKAEKSLLDAVQLAKDYSNAEGMYLLLILGDID